MKYKIKQFMKADISKIYILGVGIICLLLVGGFFSYALFTVSKERDNAIKIVTGNLIYDLKVDGTTGNTLTVPAGETKTFTITLSNPNNRKARFNFYYVGSLPSNVTAGYIVGDGVNTPPVEVGTNLEKADASGSSNTYTIRVSNKSGSSATITLGVSVGLDYNDLILPSNGHLFEEIVMTGPVSEIVIDNLTSGDIYDDGYDTFITGEDPNNYIWYSGKLWRAISVNNEANTTKLVTQWNISTLNYSSGSSAFAGSFMEDWLNDTSVDGFLGNLREPEKFIVMDSKWDATEDNRNLGEITRPDDVTLVNDAVGLLNMYEYQTCSIGSNLTNNYLNNGLNWWSLTPNDSFYIRNINANNVADTGKPIFVSGIRPSINLKSNIKIVDGNGTENDPYRLEGDNDKDLQNVKLKTRYSGEYIKFGNDEKNLYRIVSHENSIGTKITSAEPLKDSGIFKTMSFGDNINYSSTNTIGIFLNSEYLTNYVGSNYANMIEDNTTWYLGTISSTSSYKLAKYKDINMTDYTTSTEAKVGLLRFGELMAGQFNRYTIKGEDVVTNLTVEYWTLTPFDNKNIHNISHHGGGYNTSLDNNYGIKPSMNLKQNVIITGGTGTKTDPFTLSEN